MEEIWEGTFASAARQLTEKFRVNKSGMTTITRMRNILFLLIASLLYIGSVYGLSQGKTFRLDSDYDSNFPIISFVVDTIRNEKRFPMWNPYVTTGISVPGDPLSGVLYLPYLLPMLVFGVLDGWWVVVWLHAFGAGLGMWMWLTKLVPKPSFQRAKLGFDVWVWGGLLYMAGGAFVAIVAAGHIEKVLSYPWYLLFLLFLLRQHSIVIGVIMGVVFLTGDVYGLLFMGIWYGVIGVIRGIRGSRVIGEIGWAIMAFAIVSGVKLVPFIREVLPVMERYSLFDATRGSVPIWLSWLPFVVPWGVEFYDRPLLQKALGFWYNWYEYYAFIGIPLLFLFWLPRIVKRREVQLLCILLAVGIALAARGQIYSPWYGLSPLLEWFRAPQRMYGALTSIVVALIVLCVDHRIRLKLSVQGNAKLFYHLLWGGLVITYMISGYQMSQALEYPRRTEAAEVRSIREAHPGDIRVRTTSCCMQLFLVRKKIRIINYYYGWIPKPL